MPLISTQNIVTVTDSILGGKGDYDKMISLLKAKLQDYPPVRIVSISVAAMRSPMVPTVDIMSMTAVVETIPPK